MSFRCGRSFSKHQNTSINLIKKKRTLFFFLFVDICQFHGKCRRSTKNYCLTKGIACLNIGRYCAKTTPGRRGSEGVGLTVVSVVATFRAHFTAGLSETCLQKYNQQNKTKSIKFLFICFFFLYSETFIYLQ